MIERPEIAPDLGARRGPEEVGLARRRAALARRGREALAGIGDGVGEEVLPAERRAHGGHAVPMRLPPAVHRAGHGEGGQPAAGGDGLPHAPRRIPVDAGRGRGAAGAAERVEPAGASIPEQPEVVAADPVHVRIDDGDGGGGGDGGVQRIAARAERGHAGLGGQRDAARPPCRAARAPRASGWGTEPGADSLAAPRPGG